MVRETYSKSEVGEVLGKGYVAVKIDAEKGEGPELAKRFGIHGFPTMVIVDVQEDEVDRLVGYRPPDKFIADLKAVEGEGSFKALKKIVAERPENLEAALRLGMKYEERDDSDKAEALYRKVIQAEGAAPAVKVKAEGRLALSSFTKSRGQEIAPLEKFFEAHKDTADASDAARTLLFVYQRQKNHEKAVGIVKYLLAFSPDRENATLLNDLAWYLATNDLELKLALELARKAALREPKNPNILDTLAEACFRNALYSEAVDMQKKAVEMADERQREEFKKRLEKFEKALAEKSESIRV